MNAGRQRMARNGPAGPGLIMSVNRGAPEVTLFRRQDRL
jgi:hypothetical protein